MSNNSQEILRKATQDDPSLTTIRIVGYNNYDGGDDGEFYSDNSDDYSTLGAAIANNTHLEKLIVWSSDGLPLGVANRGFYDGLKSNSSISNLSLYRDGRNIAGGVAPERRRSCYCGYTEKLQKSSNSCSEKLQYHTRAAIANS